MHRFSSVIRCHKKDDKFEQMATPFSLQLSKHLPNTLAQIPLTQTVKSIQQEQRSRLGELGAELVELLKQRVKTMKEEELKSEIARVRKQLAEGGVEKKLQ